MLSPAPPPQFLSGTKLFIKGSHQIVTMKPGRNTRTETCFIMGKAGVSLEFRIWGRRLQGGWRAHALHESSAWGGSPRRGMDRSCQEELEMRKGRLDIQPLYHVQQYQLDY